jgi:hypothetical protein
VLHRPVEPARITGDAKEHFICPISALAGNVDLVPGAQSVRIYPKGACSLRLTSTSMHDGKGKLNDP